MPVPVGWLLVLRDSDSLSNRPTNTGVELLLLPIVANFAMQCFKKFIFFQTMTQPMS